VQPFSKNNKLDVMLKTQIYNIKETKLTMMSTE